MGGFEKAVNAMLASPALAPLLTRERVSPQYFLSYTFIPLSSIAFPHILIFCLTAKKMAQFKKTVVFYPLCIMAIWLPSVLLGVTANQVKDLPQISEKVQARRTLAVEGAKLTDSQREVLREKMKGDDVTLLLLGHYAPVWLAGLLGAGIMAAVMASDSQILALSTMFTEDVFAYYGGKARFGEAAQVQTGRVFVILLTATAFIIAMKAPPAIFELATQYAFAGYAALSPLLVAALFWKWSTKWGAFACASWTAIAVLALQAFQTWVPAPAPGRNTVVWMWNGWEALTRTPGGTAVFGFAPVVPMTVISLLLMIGVSLVTRKPSLAAIERYFGKPERALAARG
jgi:Na+/proline symporter